MESSELYILNVLAIVFSALSLLGSIFIILCYCRFRELQTFAFRLVFWLSVSDALKSIANMMTFADQHHSLCTLQAWMKLFFGWASVLFTCAIAFTLQQGFLREYDSYSEMFIRRKTPYYHLVCWGVSLVFSVLPFATDSYGHTGAWCWIIGTDMASVIMRFSAFYVPLLFCIGYNCVIYYHINKKLASLAGREQVTKRVKYYPVVLVIVYIFGFLNRLYELGGGAHVLWLNALMVVFISSQGTLNALVYGLTTEVKLRAFGSIAARKHRKALQSAGSSPKCMAANPAL